MCLKLSQFMTQGLCSFDRLGPDRFPLQAVDHFTLETLLFVASFQSQ